MSTCPTCASLWPRSDPADQPDSDPPHAHNMTAILAGTITGSIIFVLLFVGLLFLFHRRRRLLQINSELEAGRITPFRDERVIDISSRPLTIPGNVLPFPHDVVLDISPTSMMRLGIVGSGWNGEDASLSDGGRGGDVTRDLSVGRTLADEAELVRKPRVRSAHFDSLQSQVAMPRS